MKKVLLIEDDLDLYELLKYNLEKAGLHVVGLTTGKGAIQFCSRELPDLILLDIMLPDSSGLEICARVRSSADLASTPIIFITARSTEVDRITGLELGANDYLVKPFSIRELITRVKVQLRPPAEARTAVLQSGAIELDRRRCQVRRNGKLVFVTAREFRLLEFLMSHPGVVFSRDQLLDAVWGSKHAIIDRTIDVYVLRLRKMLETDPTNPQWICSVRGFGYRFNSEEPALPG